MNTIKINANNTKIIAHRGLSGIEKENTNAAFVAAGNRSYYGIETDVHKTLDGKYVVDKISEVPKKQDNVIKKLIFDELFHIR